MALRLVELTSLRDLPAFVQVYSSAFNGGFANRAMLPHGCTPQYIDFIVQRDSKSVVCRNQWRIAVVDDATNEIISVALWKLENKDAHSDAEDPPPQWYPEANIEAKAAFFGMIDEARHAVMGKKTYWHLALLATKPGHERKGAGRLALKWGMDRADEDGLDAFLDATPIGRPLYEKFGFRSAREQDLDLSPYGVDHLYHSTSMIRPAKRSGSP